MKKAFFITFCLLSTWLSAQTITSDFNTNNEGWQAIDSPLGGFAGSTYRATGGNPNGHISVRDILPASTMYFVAPSKFMGNKSWAYNNSLSFDLKIETGTSFSVDDVILEGSGIILVFDIANPLTSWTIYTCPLNENSGWRVGTRNGIAATKAQIQSVLCNITRLWIRAEYFTNFFDEGFLDNVNLGITACTPSVNTLPSKVICTGQSVTLNGKTYNQTGIYQDTIKRCFPECDSIVKLNLTVVDAFRVNKDTTICFGNTFKVGNKTYNETGIYKDTIKTASSCDSIITLNLKVNPIIVRPQSFTICDIENVKVLNKTYNQTGVYRDTFKTPDNCTNVIITTLIVNPTYTSGQTVSICPNSSYTIGTNTYTRAGVYRDVLKTIKGCDSIVTTTIRIESASSRTQIIKLCEGQSYSINNRKYERSGFYRDTFRTPQGCDSIVVTDLTIHPIYVSVKDTTICQGGFYKIGIKMYNQAGTYRDTLPTITNCDSIFIMTVKVLTPLSITKDTSICEGNFIRIGSKTYSQAGVYRDTIKGVKGCDSLLLTLNLTIKPERKRVIDSSICEGKTVTINGKSYKNAGNFNDTLRFVGQCDSFLVISIKIKPYTIIKKMAVLCDNDTALVNGRLFTKIGVFRDTSTSTTACNEVTEWTVVKSTLRLTIGVPPFIELGDSFRLNPSVSGAQSVQWNWTTNKATTKDLSCTNCQNPYIRPLQTTIFNLSVRDTATNCTVKDAIKVTVKPCESIYLPTAFSPNNDNQNDYLTVFASGCVRKILTMRVFNRWGVLVFSQSNFLPNTDKNGWDGRMNSQQVPPDVYIYMVELELGDGTTKLVAGDVTLIR
jgi:gliding motility-associated-like protein